MSSAGVTGRARSFVKVQVLASAKSKVVGHRGEAGPLTLQAELLLLANLLKRSASVALGKELGLSAIAWGLIGRLGHDGPMTQTEIVEKYLLDKGQLSRTAVSLARQGLIVRESKTWRSIELRLAPRGRRLYSAIDRIVRARDEKLVSGISRRDLKALHRSLAVISANATALLADE